jgi:coproporphyrinogen III oxidase
MNHSLLPNDAVKRVKDFLIDYQQNLCINIEALDTKATFRKDEWARPEGGGGISCIMENGLIFEKAGINFSHIYGDSLPKAATKTRPELVGKKFEALGVSIVFHPHNPYVPTTHANIRFFIAYGHNQDPIWWFGGGFDLTPYYPFLEDCIAWHQTAKKACYPFEDTLYPLWKSQCDEYFYLPHRDETRGIGGLFFDDYNAPDFATSFQVWQQVGLGFWGAYLPIVQKRHHHDYGQKEKDFQLYRRGRYVEFNLLYDRGTLFGIQSHGRTESILMSMPPEVKFIYNWKPEKASQEEKLYQDYLKPREWLEI